MLILLKEKCAGPVDADTDISIQFDDEETDRMRFLQEIAAGVRKKYEYRMKYLGEDEETAKSITREDKDIMNISNCFGDDVNA